MDVPAEKLSVTVVDVATHERPNSTTVLTNTDRLKSKHLLRYIITGFSSLFIITSFAVLLLVFLGYGNEGKSPSSHQCLNFHDHACKMWKAEQRSGKDITMSSLENVNEKITNFLISSEVTKIPLNSSIQKLKQMYRHCMNRDISTELGITPVVGMAKDWPLVNRETWSGKISDAFQFFAKMSRLFPFNGIFGIKIGPRIQKSNDSKKAVVWLSVGLKIWQRHEIIHPSNRFEHLKSREEYVHLIISTLQQISKQDQVTAKMANDVNELVDLEEAIAEFQNRFNPKYVTEKTVGEFSLDTQLNWSNILESIYEGQKFPASRKLIIVDKLNMMKILRTLKQHYSGPRGLVHLAVWSAIIQLLPLLDAKNHETFNQIQRVRNQFGIPAMDLLENSRNIFCINVLLEFLPWAVIRNMRSDQNATAIVQQVEHIVYHVVNSLTATLSEKLWISNDNKQVIIKKLVSMKIVIGMPKWAYNENKYEEYYKTFPMMEVNHFTNVINAAKWRNDKEVKQLDEREPLDEIDTTSLAIPSAEYLLDTNTLVIYPAALLPPIFDPTWPIALKYGMLGTIIAHELIHVLHETTSTRKVAAVVEKLNGKDEYQDNLQCIEKQYQTFCPIVDHNAKTSICVDGKRTLKENVADNGAIRHAYSAFEKALKQCPECSRSKRDENKGELKKYSDEELLFYSYARLFCPGNTQSEMEDLLLKSDHSPRQYRAIGPLTNFEEFSKTFQCTQNDPMSGEGTKPCIIW